MFLLVLTIATTVGFQGWRTLYNNFAVDEVGIQGWQKRHHSIGARSARLFIDVGRICSARNA